MVYHSNTRRAREERAHQRKKLRDAVGGAVMAIFFALLFTYALINWLSGCGEAFHQADGSIVMGECISIAQMFIGE
jgi:hypothetical protein